MKTELKLAEDAQYTISIIDENRGISISIDDKDNENVNDYGIDKEQAIQLIKFLTKFAL